MNKLSPDGIVVNKKTRELSITWNDKHVSTYPFSLLRYACPCEVCRGEQGKMSDEPPREIFYMAIEDNPTTLLKFIEKVGSYGISMDWEDGHHFGIYNWHYLRALCPCPICQEMMIYGQ